MMTLKAVDMTDDTLAGYGHLLSDTSAEPMADNEEFSYWGRIEVLDIPGSLSAGILSCKSRERIVSKWSAMSGHQKF